MDLTSIIAIISGGLSLVGVIYMLGVWRGKVEGQLNGLAKSFQDYPPAEMWTMVKTLWDIYVVDALHHRPDLAVSGSAFKLKKEGADLIPEHLTALLDTIPRNPLNYEAIATGYLVVKYIGLDLIGKMAKENQLSIQEAIALLSCYLDGHHT